MCIKRSGWPATSDLQRRFNRRHPGYEVFKKAVGEGYHLVASMIGESGKRRPCWRLSFSVAEGIILKGIFKNPRLMHKVVLKVLKVLRKKHEQGLCLYEEDFSYDIKWVFNSYVLKTMFFHECCEFPEDPYWNEDQLGERVKGILKRIRNSLKGTDIRSFFVSDFKIFNFRARRATRTKSCEKEIFRLLRKFSLS